MNKTVLVTIGAVVAVVLCIVFGVQHSQNKAINYEETIANCQSDIDVQIDRKINVLSELAECVKQYDKHEYETLTAVISAREGNKGDVDANEIVAQINAVAEAYPELKSNENYKTLMTEVSTTENLLMVHKKAYNTEVKRYNSYCRKFPTRWNLSITGYEKVDYEYYSTTNTDKPMTLFGD